MDINPNYSGFTQVYSFITDRTELLRICFYIDGKIQCSLILKHILSQSKEWELKGNL